MPAGEAFVSLADVLRAQTSAHARAVGLPAGVAGDSAPSAAALAATSAAVSHVSSSALPEASGPMMFESLPPRAVPSGVVPSHARLSEAPPSAVAAPDGPRPQAPASGVMSEPSALLSEVRLFRSALADALDEHAATLIRRLAADVLGRELQLAPVDVAYLARRLVAERLADEPIRLRVAPADAGFACDVPVVADACLNPGDAVLECRSGAIDARLGVRLADVLAAVGR